MKRLILFDIDGTLVTGPSSFHYVPAIRKHSGLEVTLEKHRISGMTAQQILQLLLHSTGWEDTRIKQEMPVLLKKLDEVHRAEFKRGSLKLLPGVKNLLAKLAKKDTVLGLITGNPKEEARRKLTDVGILDYFAVGGFGDDPHDKRSALVLIACKRAGFDPGDRNVYVIGDTWRDIEAAAEAGVPNRVGVTSLRHPKEEFEESGATLILSSLRDTNEVLSALGISNK